MFISELLNNRIAKEITRCKLWIFIDLSLAFFSYCLIIVEIERQMNQNSCQNQTRLCFFVAVTHGCVSLIYLLRKKTWNKSILVNQQINLTRHYFWNAGSDKWEREREKWQTESKKTKKSWAFNFFVLLLVILYIWI